MGEYHPSIPILDRLETTVLVSDIAFRPSKPDPFAIQLERERHVKTQDGKFVRLCDDVTVRPATSRLVEIDAIMITRRDVWEMDDGATHRIAVDVGGQSLKRLRKDRAILLRDQ